MFFCILFNYTILRDTKVIYNFLAAGCPSKPVQLVKPDTSLSRAAPGCLWVQLPPVFLMTRAVSSF